MEASVCAADFTSQELWRFGHRTRALARRSSGEVGEKRGGNRATLYSTVEMKHPSRRCLGHSKVPQKYCNLESNSKCRANGSKEMEFFNLEIWLEKIARHRSVVDFVVDLCLVLPERFRRAVALQDRTRPTHRLLVRGCGGGSGPHHGVRTACKWQRRRLCPCLVGGLGSSRWQQD